MTIEELIILVLNDDLTEEQEAEIELLSSESFEEWRERESRD